jgi:uncharacterized protein (TIGR03083 family)
MLEATNREFWSRVVPGLDWTVSQTVAHAAEGCLWYAIDLAAGGADLQTVEHRVRYDRDASELIATVRTYSVVLADVVDSVPVDQRGFHPRGLADRSGFAAMGCDELLVHAWDVARGLEFDFEPPTALAQVVLLRLFPWIQNNSGDPWRTLLWANGRIALPDRRRLDRWTWHCAPLSEWDGSTPYPISNG